MKRYEFNGGTATRHISWPVGMKAKGEIREQYHHAIDIVPTVLDALGVEAPQAIKGHVQSRFDGVSMRYSLDDGAAPTARRTPFYSMLGSRAVWHDGWKAVTNHATVAGWGNFNDDEWELYHMNVDRSELHNLASENPDKVRALQNLWFAEAGANGAFPLDDRSPLEILMTPRPVLTPARDRYVYFPDTAEIPESQAVNIRNRSYGVGALVDIPAPGARRRALLPRLPLRWPCPLRQGQPAPLRLQLRRDEPAARGSIEGRADRREPDPGGFVREDRQVRPASPTARCHSSTETRRSARHRS